MVDDARKRDGAPASHVEINRGLVAVNAVSSALTHVVGVGVLLWVNHYLLTRLSAEEYAPLPIVIALFMFLQVFTTVLTGGIARYITEAYARGEPRRVTQIVSSMFPLIALSVLAFWGLGGIASWQVTHLLSVDAGQVSDARFMLALMVLGHGIVLLAMPFSVGLHVRQKFIWLNLIKLGEQLLRLVLLCLLLFEVSTSVMWVVVATQIALLTGTAVTCLISIHLIPELRFEAGASRPSVRKELFSFGGWMMLGNLLHRFRTNADVIILNRLSTAVDVNAFHVGRLPDRQMEGLLTVVAVTMQPALIAMHAAGRHEGLKRAYLRGNRYYLWAMLAMAVPLFVYAEELVLLYAGQTYLVAATVLQLRCATYPITYANEMLFTICLAKARIRTFFLIMSASAVVHLALAIVLVGYFQTGVLGIAYMSLCLAAVVQFGFLWPLGLRLVGLSFGPFLRRTLLPGYLPAAGTLMFGFAAKSVLQPATWLDAGIGVGICLLVYAALMTAFSTAEDRRDAGVLFRRIKSRVGPRIPAQLRSSS